MSFQTETVGDNMLQSAVWRLQVALGIIGHQLGFWRHPSFISLWQETVVPFPLGSPWAAGWWGWAHSLSSQDREVGRGSLYTPVQPFWPCQGSACWGDVPSACSRSADPQTEVRGPWRALEPDPSPAGAGSDSNSTKCQQLLQFSRSACAIGHS